MARLVMVRTLPLNQGKTLALHSITPVDIANGPTISTMCTEARASQNAPRRNPKVFLSKNPTPFSMPSALFLPRLVQNRQSLTIATISRPIPGRSNHHDHSPSFSCPSKLRKRTTSNCASNQSPSSRNQSRSEQ